MRLLYPLDPKFRVSGDYGAQYSGKDGSRRFRFHEGTDHSCPLGSNVYSSGDGMVVFTEKTGYYKKDGKFYGNRIEIYHDEYDMVFTLYAHLSQIFVKTGDRVKAGQIIGLSGGTPGAIGAGNSVGEHLHYEVREGSNERGWSVDPLTVWTNAPDGVFYPWAKRRLSYDISNTEGMILWLKDKGIKLDKKRREIPSDSPVKLITVTGLPDSSVDNQEFDGYDEPPNPDNERKVMAFLGAIALLGGVPI